MKFTVTIDFNDDIWLSETDWTADKLRESIAELARRGITGIRWVEHGRLDDGLYDEGSKFDRNGKVQRVCQHMPDPRQVVIDAAHEHGMEVVQVLKPNDLAFGYPCVGFPHGHGPQPPVGLPEIAGEGGAAVKWLREHPDVRERLHPSLLEADKPRRPIRTIRLWHGNADLPEAPPVEIFVSDDNYKYSRYEGPMQVTQSVRRRRPPLFAPVPEKLYGDEGDRVCLELAGLEIEAPFVVVQPIQPWPLENTLQAMVEIEDDRGEAVVFTWGVAHAQPQPAGVPVPWQEGGVAYDCARKSLIPRGPLATTSALRMSLNLAEQGWIGMARGRNEYYGAYVDLAEPEVREWLLGLVKDALDAGVDGVDVRMSGHAESLDTENYGFGPKIVEAFRERHGVDITKEPFDRAAWREIRGEFFRQFLSEVAQTVRERKGKVLAHVHQTMDNPATESIEQQMAWHWRRWIQDDLIDMLTFKVFAPEQEFYQQALEICREHNLPKLWDRKPHGSDKQQGWLESIDQALADGFEEFDLYEMAVFHTLRADGTLDFKYPELWKRIAELTEGKEV